MTGAEVVNPPPATVSLFNFPILGAVVISAALTAFMLFVAAKFDPTQGVLTISIMIVFGMLGATAYCLIYTIPVDDITPSVVGGLTAGFGAVLAYWFGRGKG